MRRIGILLPLVAASLAGCAATIPPVEVTRFHLKQPIAGGALAIETAPTIEGATYGNAVRNGLVRHGFNEGTPADYTAKTTFSRLSREQARSSPFRIGIGGGSYGGGLGIGVGTSIGLGSTRREIVVTRLAVQLVRNSDKSVVWEGRAETEAPANAPAAQPGLAAQKLAEALFADFPGESGKTVLVP